jgi:hypothetical protein
VSELPLTAIVDELRRIRQAVERIADTVSVDSTPFWRLAGLAADPGGEIEVRVSAERMEELSRRCAEAPRIDTAAADAFLKARKEARGG